MIKMPIIISDILYIILSFCEPSIDLFLVCKRWNAISFNVFTSICNKTILKRLIYDEKISLVRLIDNPLFNSDFDKGFISRYASQSIDEPFNISASYNIDIDQYCIPIEYWLFTLDLVEIFHSIKDNAKPTNKPNEYAFDDFVFIQEVNWMTFIHRKNNHFIQFVIVGEFDKLWPGISPILYFVTNRYRTYKEFDNKYLPNKTLEIMKKIEETAMMIRRSFQRIEQ